MTDLRSVKTYVRASAVLLWMFTSAPVVAWAHPLPFLQAQLYMQRSAEYRAVCKTIYQAARALLEQRVRVGEFAPQRPPAVVMDLDETVLDNSGYEACLQRLGSDYSAPLWEAWIAYQASCSEEHPNRAVPGAVEFIHAMQALGVEVIYVSNRSSGHDGLHATARILGQLGLQEPKLLEHIWLVESKDEEARRARLLLASLKDAVDSPRGRALLNSHNRKERRRLEAEQRYTVLGFFGDDLYDFSVYAPASEAPGARLLQVRQEAVEQAGAVWGTRWFALPNPVYGSWVASMGKSGGVESLDDQGFSDYLKTRGEVASPKP